MDEPIARTYRWRRREVVKTRITWVGLVAMLLLLIHKEVSRGMAMTPKAAWFIVLVVIPLVLLLLWRSGLLPPERVAVDGEPQPTPPLPDAPPQP